MYQLASLNSPDTGGRQGSRVFHTIHTRIHECHMSVACHDLLTPPALRAHAYCMQGLAQHGVVSCLNWHATAYTTCALQQSGQRQWAELLPTHLELLRAHMLNQQGQRLAMMKKEPPLRCLQYEWHFTATSHHACYSSEGTASEQCMAHTMHASTPASATPGGHRGLMRNLHQPRVHSARDTGLPVRAATPACP